MAVGGVVGDGEGDGVGVDGLLLDEQGPQLKNGHSHQITLPSELTQCPDGSEKFTGLSSV